MRQYRYVLKGLSGQRKSFMIQDTKEPVKLGIDLGKINEDINDKAEETGKIKKRNKIKTGMT
jgi:hypothetical protein